MTTIGLLLLLTAFFLTVLAFSKKKKSSKYRISRKSTTPAVKSAEDWILEFKHLSRAAAKETFDYLQTSGLYLPNKAYVYLVKKKNGEVFFSEDEYAKRTAENKPVQYVYPAHLILENAVQIMTDSSLILGDKLQKVSELIGHQNIKYKTEVYWQLYTAVFENITNSSSLTEQNYKFIKSEKRRLSTGITKGNITSSQIPFSNLDKLLRGHAPTFIDFTKKTDSKRL